MPKVSLVTSYGCTPCLRVKRILKELQSEMPNLTLEEIDYTSSTGAKLSMENNIQYPPAVLLNGKLIAKGKINAKELIQTIREINGNRP